MIKAASIRGRQRARCYTRNFKLTNNLFVEGEHPKIRTMAKDLDEVRRRTLGIKEQPNPLSKQKEVVKSVVTRDSNKPEPAVIKDLTSEVKPISRATNEVIEQSHTPFTASEPYVKTRAIGDQPPIEKTETKLNFEEEAAKSSRQAPTPPPIRSPQKIVFEYQRPASAPKEAREQVSDLKVKQVAEEPEKTLAEILNEARSRIDQRPSQSPKMRKSALEAVPQGRVPQRESKSVPEPEEAKGEMSLDELLPIEEVGRRAEETRPSVYGQDIKMQDFRRENMTPFSKSEERIIPPKTTAIPPNLPLERSEELMRPEPVVQPGPTFLPDIKPRQVPYGKSAESVKAKKETPEEILGIKSSEEPKTAMPKRESIYESATVAPKGSPIKASHKGGMLTPDEIAEIAKNRPPLEEFDKKIEAAKAPQVRAREYGNKPIGVSSEEAEIEKLLEERGARRKKRPSVLSVLIVLALIVLISGGASFAYIKFFKKNVEEPLPLEPKPPIETSIPQTPKPLLKVDSTTVITVKQLSYEEILPKLETLRNSSFPEESVTHLPLLLHNDQEARFINLSEFFTLMGIPAPANLKEYDNFSLFLYSQTKEEEELCIASGIIEKTCYGPRLGLVVDLASRKGATVEEGSNEAIRALVDWEATTMVKDLSNLILSPTPTTPPTSFLSGRYGNIPTRYINLPIHTTSIDWIIVDRYFIIATSMDSARTAVSRLEGAGN